MLDIVFISDYVCPYCLVAKEALEENIIEMKLRGKVKITHLPFELTPPEKPQVDTYNDPVRRSHYRILEVPCEEMNLNMLLPPSIVPRPRTRLAYEAWLYACDHDRGNLWNSSMYHAYFMENLDIGDREQLKHIAKTLLLDPADLEKAWDEGRYTQKLLDMEQQVKDTYHPTHVPTIVVNGKVLELKDYSKNEMAALLVNALQKEKAKDEERAPSDAAPTGGCGPDGCEMPQESSGGCGPDGCGM